MPPRTRRGVAIQRKSRATIIVARTHHLMGAALSATRLALRPPKTVLARAVSFLPAQQNRASSQDSGNACARQRPRPSYPAFSMRGEARGDAKDDADRRRSCALARCSKAGQAAPGCTSQQAEDFGRSQGGARGKRHARSWRPPYPGSEWLFPRPTANARAR
jgi:hypothetical protein